jgi:hypothetical protein
MHAGTRTRTHERAGGRGDGEGSREEGFITRDLLLLPGGGKPLQRATAMHTYARARGVFIRYVQFRALRADVCVRAHTYTRRDVARVPFPSDRGLSCPPRVARYVARN